MPHDRFFLNAPFHPDEEVQLTDDEAHHLMRVMRKKEGDPVELVNGKNQMAIARVEKIEKRGVDLRLTEVQEKEPPSRSLIVCQALPRLNRLDTIVEKGTELGMTALWLFPGELSEKKDLSPQQLERLHGIAIAAMKQCGRFDLPSIALHPPLNRWSSLEPSTCAYFGDLDPRAPPFLEVLRKHPPENLLFFVGPEGGFTSTEEERLRALGAKGVCLHPNILRTDTASLVVLSLISNLFLTKY